MSRRHSPEFTTPYGIAVLYRARRGLPWVELGRVPTMREAVKLVNGKGMFWLNSLTAKTVADKVNGETGHSDDLEANSASSARGESDRRYRGDESKHGIRPVGLMPKDVRTGKTCATIEDTSSGLDHAARPHPAGAHAASRRVSVNTA